MQDFETAGESAASLFHIAVGQLPPPQQLPPMVAPPWNPTAPLRALVCPAVCPLSLSLPLSLPSCVLIVHVYVLIIVVPTIIMFNI